MNNIALQPLSEDVRESYCSAFKSLSDDLNRVRQELSDSVNECLEDYRIRQNQADASRKELQAEIEQNNKKAAQLQVKIAAALSTGNKSEVKSMEESMAELEKSKQNLVFKLKALDNNTVPCDEMLYKLAEEKDQELSVIDAEYRKRLREVIHIWKDWQNMFETLIKAADKEAFGNGWGVLNSSATWHNRFTNLMQAVGKVD